MSVLSLTDAHSQFLTALPAIDRTSGSGFDGCRAIADGRAAAWHAWYGLLRRGKDPQAVGVTGLAHNVARYCCGGRRSGTGTSGRGTMDVFSPRARKARGYRIVSLDRSDADAPAAGPNAWHDPLPVCDNSVSPADQMAFKLDLMAWLDTLPPRKQRIAELLAEGHETGVVAGMVGVTAGRVGQVRSESDESWQEFQAQVVAV